MSYATDKLEKAIKTMKEACTEAEETLATESFSEIKRAAMILHELTWGLANATTNIEAAMRSTEADLIAQIEQKEK